MGFKAPGTFGSSSSPELQRGSFPRHPGKYAKRFCPRKYPRTRPVLQRSRHTRRNVLTQHSGAFERNGRGIRSRVAAEKLKGCFCGCCDRWRRDSAPSFSQPRPALRTRFWRKTPGVFALFLLSCRSAGGTPAEGQGEAQRSVDRRGYKSGEAASRLYFCL